MRQRQRAIPAQVEQVLARAATNRTNLSVAALAGAAALMLQSWPILALGGAAYSALVALDMMSLDFWRRALSAPPPARLATVDAIRDAGAHEAARAIRSARNELERILTTTPDDVRSHLAMALAGLDELEQRAAELIVRSEEIATFLTSTKAEPIRQEIQRLGDKARRANGGDARDQYELARTAREEQLRAVLDIEEARERLAAHLARLVAAFEGLPVQIVRMRVLDGQAMDTLSGDMSRELEHVSSEIKSFDDVLNHLEGTSP